MILLRVITRVIGALLTLALALVCLGVAAYCLDALISLGSLRPDRLLHLVSFRHQVGRFLTRIAAPGPTAELAMAGGVVAILIGLLLLVGTLRSSRERLVVLDGGREGTLAARPRIVRLMAQSLAEQAAGATAVKRPKLKSSRRGTRGRLALTASRSRSSDPKEVKAAVISQLEPVTGPFHLRPRVDVREGDAGERVQ